MPAEAASSAAEQKTHSVVIAFDGDDSSGDKPLAWVHDPLLLYRKHGGGASQLYAETMSTNAMRVLAESYAAEGFDDAEVGAKLIIEHLMRAVPVYDRATFERLGHTIGALQAHFIATREVDADSLRMIRWESALRWGRVVRTGLKAGTIGLMAAMAVRPDHLGLGYSSMEELVGSRLIGGARTAVRNGRAA